MGNLSHQINLENVPIGSTNIEVSQDLQNNFHLSFRKAQDVLVAMKKLNKGGGWFVSERTRIKNAQNEIYLLARALKSEGFNDLPAVLDASGKTSGVLTPKESVFVFMNFFAQAFPNWRPEYEALNGFVPQLF